MAATNPHADTDDQSLHLFDITPAWALIVFSRVKRKPRDKNRADINAELRALESMRDNLPEPQGWIERVLIHYLERWLDKNIRAIALYLSWGGVLANIPRKKRGWRKLMSWISSWLSGNNAAPSAAEESNQPDVLADPVQNDSEDEGVDNSGASEDRSASSQQIEERIP